MTPDLRLLRWPAEDRDHYWQFANAVARVRAMAARSRGDYTVPVIIGPEEPSELDRAQILFAQRRARDAAAGQDAELFGEPAWDMMLALFIAHEEARPMPMRDLFDHAGVGPTVARRWIDDLAARGLINLDAAETAGITDRGLQLVLRCLSPI